ncbi:NAD(P)-dependent oxidoreductase [Clostridium sp. AN503]|uniref:NAD(P)-dependent oxidoreductase n=1 Tax=Clostridium sp. AN503 TaxID=3160598 RepID=UPI003459705F
MKNIAFFGLGNMGLPMAKNLLKAGYNVKVSVFQGLREAPEELQKLGAVLVDTQADMVRDADVIISIVPADAAVKEIYLNPEIRNAIPDRSIIIEMTSCAPETVIEVQKAYEEKGVKVIDAPVTGAKIGAVSGTLTIMGTGDPEAFEAVRPVLEAMGKKIYNLGPVGNGKWVKAAGNLLGAVTLAAVGEICRLSKTRDLDYDLFMEVMSDGAGGSTQFTRNFMKMVKEDFEPTFALKLLRKDMAIALDMAGDLPLPLSRRAYELYKNAAPYDEEDCAAIAKVEA